MSLNPKHQWEPDLRKSKCQVEDEKHCPKTKLPATRPERKDNDSSYKVACGEPDRDESKVRRRGAKSQYVYVYMDNNGKASEFCKHTKKCQDRKLEKLINNDVRVEVKEWFSTFKPYNDSRDEERQTSLKRLKEIQEQRDKDTKDRDKNI